MAQPEPDGEQIGKGAASAPLLLCGQALVADLSGALFWPAEQALLVADLHLEKGSAQAERGLLLPPYDTRETLARLAQAIDRYRPRRVIALGDSFHDARAPARLDGDDRDTLRALQGGRDWVWIAGNHDPGGSARVGGQALEVLGLAGLTLRHEPTPGPASREIAGHLHPAAKLALRGTSIRRPCFVGNAHRLVLPAFGAFTGGLNVLDAAFRPLFDTDRASGMAVCVLGQDGLYPVPTRLLCAD